MPGLPGILKGHNLQSLNKALDLLIEFKFCESDFYFLNRSKNCMVATYNFGSVYMDRRGPIHFYSAMLVEMFTCLFVYLRNYIFLILCFFINFDSSRIHRYLNFICFYVEKYYFNCLEKISLFMYVLFQCTKAAGNIAFWEFM